MIDVNIAIGLQIAHWLADFVMQTTKWQKGKSNNIGDLLSHTGAYIATMWIIGFIYFCIKNGLDTPSSDYLNWFLFCFVTFIIHTIQDYLTSKLNAWLQKKGKNKAFWVSLSFDQLLHFIQLIKTYKFFFP